MEAVCIAVNIMVVLTMLAKGRCGTIFEIVLPEVRWGFFFVNSGRCLQFICVFVYGLKILFGFFFFLGDLF